MGEGRSCKESSAGAAQLWAVIYNCKHNKSSPTALVAQELSPAHRAGSGHSDLMTTDLGRCGKADEFLPLGLGLKDRLLSCPIPTITSKLGTLRSPLLQHQSQRDELGDQPAAKLPRVSPAALSEHHTGSQQSMSLKPLLEAASRRKTILSLIIPCPKQLGVLFILNNTLNILGFIISSKAD